MDKTNFVCTSDEETRKKLLEEGFVEVKNSNGIYTFLFDGKKNFSVDKEKLTFTNNMCI